MALPSSLDSPENVVQRLAELSPIFAKASVGDFSQDVHLPPDDDPFIELFAGVQIMLDVIREKIAALEKSNVQLNRQVKDLERLNRFMVGRELKMRELKREVAQLKKRLDQLAPPPV